LGVSQEAAGGSGRNLESRGIRGTIGAEKGVSGSEMRKYRNWIPGLVFWALFLISIALGRRYPWLDTIWYAAWMLFLIIVAVYGVLEMFRNRHDTAQYVGYRGVPRWVVRFFGDDSK